jgi:tetratricopeptide (TPR) repeat protein
MPKKIFIVLAVVVAVTLPILSFDFGITEDEQLHNQHGHSILDYFLGHSDRATRNPIDHNGKLIFEYDREMNDVSGALNIYGGFFDLLCAVTYRYLSPLGEFENRHFVNALFGVLLILFTGLTAQRIAGWRAGILALLLMALSPRIIGHSMNNPVDLPFAALYMCALFFIIRFLQELPRPRKRTWIPLLIAIPLAADIRIAGLVLIPYLLLFVGVWCLSRGRLGVVRSIGVTVLLCTGAYLLVSLLWPLAHGNPLGTPLMALRHLSQLETFNAYDLFEGRWVNRWEVPWYFVPKWLLIGTPLYIPLGLLASPFAFTARLPRKWIALVAFAFLFPVLLVVLRESYVYNDARHLLFAYPPLVAFCAVALQEVGDRLKSVPQPFRRVLTASFLLLIAGSMLEPLLFMVRNHRNQGVYFSPLIGGVAGAWRQYETDYWGNSTRQAVEWIQEHSDPGAAGPVRIRIWYGDQTKARYYIEKQPGFVHVIDEQTSTEWDYEIVQTVACKYSPGVLQLWPPAGTVYEVKADDTPLVAVVLNFRNHERADVLDRMLDWARQEPAHATYLTLASTYYWDGDYERWAEAFRHAAERNPEPVGRTHDEYLNLAQKFRTHEKYEESVLACRLALRKNPDSALAYNDLCASYNAWKRWPEAREACEAALALEPGFPRAEFNLNLAIEGQKEEPSEL